MKNVKTIKQHSTTYTITMQGNCSFRVSYISVVTNRPQHVDSVFGSVEAAENYIAACNSMDAMAAFCK